MVTLDNIHSDTITQIKQFDLSKMEKHLSTLSKKKEELNKTLDVTHADAWVDLLREISECEQKIDNYKSKKNLHEYYLNTGDVLFQYYDTIENVGEENTPKQSNISDKHDSILSYLYTSDQQSETDALQESPDSKHISNNNYIFDKYASREELRAEYLMRINENKFDNKKQVQKFKSIPDVCTECNSELTLIQSESIIECISCGHILNIIVDTEKTSYKEPPKESCYYSYRRSNHFNEWIAQFQGKETTQIPRQVLLQVVSEIKKERIQDLSTLSNQKVRMILKKLRMNKYYEHIPYIINLLNNRPPPIITRSTEEILRLMFQKIQGPFIEFCPKKRKNFLSYSYVLNKFVGLLGLDHLQPLFPLLKSREKLHCQDAIWKKICESLGWEFQKSI
tara:strand:+ start:1160 stop:2341 length:1182 start_codon:yes stop_codon:yes gene_type:complete